ncbi:T9SS type A sorting domain-containing protein [Winogradskyella sp.]|uniref:DUF7619 domain-containing protein n=1 Tax=Winogradskyella sp. TaxID=1883156 RepID=UPI0025D156A9|nr:T9SS type A sorting domain-containing protein [Winogradskyella sp.]
MIKKIHYLLLLFSITLTSFAQVANQPGDLAVCDGDNDGFSQFDFSILDAQIFGSQNPADFTLTYHETQSDANAGFNSIASPYDNVIANIQTIYIRLEENSSGSFDTTTVNLIVNPYPIAIQPTPIELCDDFGEIPVDEITVFDLTVKDAEIIGVNPNRTVAYYETNADAVAQTNVITNSTAYTNTSVNGLPANPQTLYVVVTDINTSCVGFTTLTIRVLPNPTPSSVIPDLVLCDENNTEDGVEVFDLTENELLIFNGEVGTSITYYISEADAISASNAIINPTTFTNTFISQTVYARVENDITSCFSIVNFDLIVDPSPEVDLGLPEQNYCGFDSVTLVANSPFADEFIWYKNGFVLTGETSSTLLVTESDIYEAQTINNQCGVSAFSGPVVLNLYEEVGSIEPQTILACPDAGSDTADFDLDAFSASLGFGEGITVSYYTSISNANQAINALISPYNSAGETLIMRVEDTDAAMDGFLGCRQLTNLELVIDCENTGFISVGAFYDDNNNSVFDASEENFTNGYFTYEINNDGIINTVESSVGRFLIESLDEVNTYDISYYFYNEYEDCFDVSTTRFDDVSVLFGENVTIEFPVVNEQSCEDIAVYLINQQSPRPGFNHTNYLVIQNLGVLTTSGTIDYILDENLTISNISTSSNYSTAPNTNGFSLDFINLLPNSSITVVITLYTPASVALGEIVTNTAIYTTSSNDIVANNNESFITEAVIGSYDPNDKMESHGSEIVYDDFIATNEYLYYTVRFQNVGTAEAIFIRIEDELDAQLDETTFQMLRSSHDYQVTRIGNDLEWFFDDINLPAEQDDEEGSNGFVHFKIKPKLGYSVGDIITNTASIYFDFNAPIITNTFTTTFVEPLSVDSFESIRYSMYPNPAKESVTITLSSSNYENSILSIYDVQGKQILKQLNDESSIIQLDVSALQSGLYFVQLSNGTHTQVEKLVIE